MSSTSLAAPAALLILVLAAGAAAHHDPRSLHVFDGSDPAGRFGRAVAAAGDVDGDGHGDIVVGAPFANGVVRDGGRVHLYSGVDGRALRSMGGSTPSSWFGFAVAGAGDVDGDGRADVAVGEPLADGARGRVQVLSGASGAELWRRSGSEAGDQLGRSLAAVGDVDGDGVSDLLAGAPYADAAGTSSGLALLLSGRDGTLIQSWTGSAWDFYGSAVAAGGDVDVDGVPDLVVGAPFADVGAFNSGSAIVLSGRFHHVIHAFHGSGIGDQLGSDVDGAGDADGDGVADLVMGAPGADANGIDSGAVEVRSGATGALITSVAGSASGEYLFSVAGIGDADRDGHDDVLVGAASGGDGEAGRVHLVSGRSGLPLATIDGRARRDWFGASLAAMGDIDGDGTPELAVGAPGHDDELDKRGYVQVFSAARLAPGAARGGR